MSAGLDLYRCIVNAVPEGIWVVSPEGSTVFCNERMAEMLGTDVESLERLSCFDPLFPEDVEEAHRQFGLQMSGGGQPFDFRLRRNDGSALWVSISCKPMRDDAGTCVGLLGLFSDISERRRTESKLQDSEKLFRAIFSQAAVGIAQTSLTGDWLLVNNRLCEFLGYTQPELRTRTLLDVTHPDDRQSSLDAIRQLLSGEISSWLTEKRYIRKSGTVVWARLFTSLVRDGNNQPQYFIKVVEEVTERIQAERSLQESQQQLRLALSTGLGVWECDLTGGAVVLSPQYRSAFGYSPVSIVEWMKLIHSDDRERVVALARKGVQQRQEWEAEFRVLWPDGSVRWMLSKGKVILDENGRPARMVGISLDVTERKLAEVRLRESEERFRTMADSAPVMIWVSGLDKGCTFFNKPWLDFTGQALEQELGSGWTKGVHPEDLDCCSAAYHSSFDARRAMRMEYRLRRADGEYRWLLNNGTPLYRGGEFVGFIGSCIDISEHKLIQERLLASETQLKDAQRLAKVGSWERKIDTAVSLWSDENRRILGIPNDAPANFSTFMNCVHPKDREKVLEVERRVRTTGGLGEVQYRIIRPDGEIRFVHSVLEALRNDQGTAVRIVGASQDVTGQIEASERLRQSEHRMKNAERVAHLGHWQWDLQANRVSGSEEMYRIFGKPFDYIPSYEGLLAELIPQDRAQLERMIEDSIERKVGNSMDYRIAQPDGNLQTISCIWEVLTDEEGLPVQLFGTCQDISNSRRAQEESFAKQKLETVGTLASGIAHDFNNLLGAVLAQTELAREELAAGASPDKELQAICDVATRGSEIVRELMIYAGKESEPPGLVDVSQIVGDMLQLLKVLVSKHATLEVVLGERLPAVQATVSQISQLVMNLVTNASEAIGDRDGTIRITTQRVTVGGGSREIGSLTAGEYVQFEVSDTGCGMPAETQDKVFDPFLSTKSPGRGLGLAVVQGIVRKLGGTVNFASEQGRGTTFQILLPSCETTLGPVQRPLSSLGQAAKTFPRATVLIVEDEEPLRQAVSKMLAKHGFSVIEAPDGSAAVDAIRGQNNPIHVLFLDVTLPGASGREILQEARRLRPEMRVVVTSAYTEEMSCVSLQSPIEHFIRKPYRLDDLVQLIRPNAS